jgi:hydroxymethylglutaryl-CoA synthase
MAVGLVSYGAYIPKYRLKSSQIDQAWGKESSSKFDREKSVPAFDEDAVTQAVEASFNAFRPVGVSPSEVEVLLMGSESHPYAVKPSSATVGNLLGTSPNYLAADLEFACKAGSAGIQLVSGLISSGHAKYGLAIGSDTAQGKPNDALEYSSAAAAAAFLLGEKKLVVRLLDFCSYTTDTPDFWRRDGSPYPSHAGRFTGEPAYFAHIMGAADQLMSRSKIKSSDVDFCVFHMPNPKFPRDVARKLGFTPDQLAPSLIVDKIGNPYSASSLLGLAAVLDQARPGQRIFMVSYGSGAGSDAFLWQVEAPIVNLQKAHHQAGVQIEQQLANKAYIDYLGYLRHTHKI